ncbi:MAG: CCA tRNA nucleotidyltransferase [Chloroflexota bacterium]
MDNFASEMEKQLPAELAGLLALAGETARNQGQELYLVGGAVRDLLLGTPNLDLDLVASADAIALAGEMARLKAGKLITHPRFHTATVRWGQWSVDLATARSESYAHPGALPTVRLDTMERDLYRRDFTINAMAIDLTPGQCGELLDPYGGRDDLSKGFIRILHGQSFTDDATRIWRALRYEQRLDFRLEPATLCLLQRDIPRLDTISGDRLRYELECVLREERPEKVLRRAAELGVLGGLHPSLSGDGWLEARFAGARRLYSPGPPPPGLYLALLAWPLSQRETEEFITRLRLPKALCQVMRDSLNLRARTGLLASPGLSPGGVHSLLDGFSPAAITAARLAADSPVAGQHLRLFQDKWRYIKPALTGADLINLGVAPGPRLKAILKRLQQARLDGRVSNRREETALVKQWLAGDKGQKS